MEKKDDGCTPNDTDQKLPARPVLADHSREENMRTLTGGGQGAEGSKMCNSPTQAYIEYL